MTVGKREASFDPNNPSSTLHTLFFFTFSRTASLGIGPRFFQWVSEPTSIGVHISPYCIVLFSQLHGYSSTTEAKGPPSALESSTAATPTGASASMPTSVFYKETARSRFSLWRQFSSSLGKYDTFCYSHFNAGFAFTLSVSFALLIPSSVPDRLFIMHH